MLTEEEAKTKWCPFSRYGEFYEDEPHALNPIPCRCIANDCMAWRQEIRAFNVALNRFLVPGETYSSLDRIDHRPSGRGFCGLAGSPT